MAWIESLSLETWIVNVFAGNAEIFGAIALFVISALAGFFRMNGIMLFFMLGLFFLMFSGYIGGNFLILLSIFGGLIVGYVISKMF